MAKEVKNKKEKRHFFKDFKAELKKVSWPTPKQLLNNTSAVIAVVLFTCVIVFVLDLAFEKINTHGIDRLRNVVESTQVSNTTNETNTNSDSNTAGETNNSVDNNIAE